MRHLTKGEAFVIVLALLAIFGIFATGCSGAPTAAEHGLFAHEVALVLSDAAPARTLEPERVEKWIRAKGAVAARARKIEAEFYTPPAPSPAAPDPQPPEAPAHE